MEQGSERTRNGDESHTTGAAGSRPYYLYRGEGAAPTRSAFQVFELICDLFPLLGIIRGGYHFGNHRPFLGQFGI